MDNSSDANDALLKYIDSLLLDGETPNENISNGAAVDNKAVEPEAAEKELRLLLFKVGGVPLAISMDDVAEIIDRGSALDYELEEGLPREPFLYGGREIYPLDTREMIFPEGHPARSASARAASSHIIVLTEFDVGLSCDELGEIVDVEQGGIEWRQRRSTRPWLAGMVKANNHALLDIGKLVADYQIELSTYH